MHAPHHDIYENMKRAVFHCLRDKCKNRVMMIDDVLVTCESSVCKRYIEHIPLEVLLDISSQYKSAICCYHINGYIDALQSVQHSLQGYLQDICTDQERERIEHIQMASEHDDKECDIKKKMSKFFMERGHNDLMIELWDYMGWKEEDYV